MNLRKRNEKNEKRETARLTERKLSCLNGYYIYSQLND